MNASRENICEIVLWCVVKMSFRASSAEFDSCFCRVKGLPRAPAGGGVDLGSQVGTAGRNRWSHRVHEAEK